MNDSRLDFSLEEDDALHWDGPITLTIDRSQRVLAIRCAAMEDSRLSFRAKGILAYLVTRPDGERTALSDLSWVGPDDEDRVGDALEELRALGYIYSSGGKEYYTDWPELGEQPSPPSP